MIALINETTGVCLDGRWKGWLFSLRPNGQWVSDRELKKVDPLANNPLFQMIEHDKPEYTEGVCGYGAAILKDGQPITIEQILAELNK